MSDILDRIDEALTTPLHCPHCDRDWHPGPLTAAVLSMLLRHEFDADYDPATDKTRIVCVGAEYQGPLYQAPEFGSPYPTGYFMDALTGAIVGAPWVTSQAWASVKAIASAWDMLQDILGDTAPLTYHTWLGEPPEPEPCTEPVDLLVEFGPQYWLTNPKDQPPALLPPPVHAAIASAPWNPDAFPVPESPGYDFSQYATDETDYTAIGKGRK